MTLRRGEYGVSAASVSGYRTKYSSGCSGSISGGQTINCTVTNQYSLISLNVITKVDNNNAGTNNPSDFTITVSGNNPSPRIFSGSSSGTSVTLRPGSYEVTANRILDYITSYSSGCSGTAKERVPIECTITNQYHWPPSSPVNPSITITTESKSVNSIPSTFVKVDTFSTNYTIAGKMSSMNASKELITSTIVDDFGKNPNIGYVLSSTIMLTMSYISEYGLQD